MDLFAVVSIGILNPFLGDCGSLFRNHGLGGVTRSRVGQKNRPQSREIVGELNTTFAVRTFGTLTERVY